MVKSKKHTADQTPQIVLDALMEKREVKNAEWISHLAKADETKKEVDDLDKAIMKMQGRKRKQRTDKGKKRKTNSKKHTLSIAREPENKFASAFDNATFAGKVVLALASLKRFLHNREIGEFFHKYDSSISTDKWVERLSARASRLKNDGVIVAHQVEGNIRNTFYGLPGWLDEGEIKEGFEYNEKYLVGNKKEIA